MIHIALHFIVPLVLARMLYPTRWLRCWGLMLMGLLIDVDHLLADPIYAPERCSIGFHPLHGALPMLLYIALWAWPKTRLLGMGLMVHLLLDAVDCKINLGVWSTFS